MKHFSIITFVLLILLCSSIFAAEVNTIVASKVRAEADKVIVPLELKNVQTMSALDLPLTFSKGVTLEEVRFEGTRSADFDFKIGNIYNDKQMVIIGLIPMVYGQKSDLAPGNGEIADLVFRIDDPAVKEITLTPTTTNDPDHSPMFVYVDEKGAVASMTPELSGFSVALTGAVATAALPTDFALKQNAPNPFNPTTSISYDLPKPAKVRLEIFNVLGQRVKTLVDNYQEAGTQSVIWDGRDNAGSSVASGIYFYRLSAGDFTATMKMMMLK